jgi:hypothetical protein
MRPPPKPVSGPTAKSGGEDEPAELESEAEVLSGFRVFEIRNPKSEIRNKFEIQNSKVRNFNGTGVLAGTVADLQPHYYSL